MSTKMLLLMALACGIVILLAFAIQVTIAT